MNRPFSRRADNCARATAIWFLLRFTESSLPGTVNCLYLPLPNCKLTVRYFIVFLVLTWFSASGQGYEPLELSKKVFARDTFPDLPRYSTGEYQGHPNGRDLAPGLKAAYKLLEQNDQTAVVAVTFIDSAGKYLNTYLHFKKDGNWKIAAFRALAMTGMIETVHEELSAMSPEQVDRIIYAHLPADKDHRPFKTKKEYIYQWRNTGLTLASDSELVAYFRQHKPEFEKLKTILEARGLYKSAGGVIQMPAAADLMDQVKALYLNNVSPIGASALNFNIGGIIDNTVGYLYVKDKKDLPKMSPDDYIMIMEIGDGWYLYKTT